MPSRIKTTAGRTSSRKLDYRKGKVNSVPSMNTSFSSSFRQRKSKMPAKWNAGCKNCG